jgi:hypothetical protein
MESRIYALIESTLLGYGFVDLSKTAKDLKEEPVSELRFEPGTFRIGSRNANISNITFQYCSFIFCKAEKNYRF